MKRTIAILAGVLLLAGFALPAAAQEKPAIATTTLKVGDTAPDFTLPSDTEKEIKLSDYRGKKNVILAFYVLAFTGG